ncbi:MAG: PAS domain-containing protein [Actinomycetota bacterium]|nr:PAS domain-containing protein [Actinomycetota bacterium]
MDIEEVTKEQLINKLMEMNQRIIDLRKSERQFINYKKLLEKNEGKYRSLLQTSSVGIIIIDYRGIITECNDAALDFSGYSRERLIGKYFTRRVNISTRDIPRYLEIFRSILEGKEVGSFEISQHKKMGMFFSEKYISVLWKIKIIE